MAELIDFVPVARARWVKRFVATDEFSYCYYACSRCGETIPRTSYGSEYFSNYCPSCGAKMDAEVDGGEVD